MIKILLFADTHLGFDLPHRKGSKRPHRGEDFFRNFQYILDFAIEQKVDLLLHGGDFFYRSKVPAFIYNRAYEILFDFAEKGIPIVIVPGNHERSVLPQSILTRHPNIHIFTEPGRFNFKLHEINITLSGFPFIRKNIAQRFPSIVKVLEKDLDPTSYNILCFHQAVEGSTVGPVDFTFRKGEDVICFADLPDIFNLIFSGHIHRRQILWKQTSGKKLPLVYPGSIERTSFAEKDEQKGFYLLQIENISPGDYRSTLSFKTLSARNMIDLKIPTWINSEVSFYKWLDQNISSYEKNSIIRLSDLSDNTYNFLTRRKLDRVLPAEMIVQFRYRSRSKKRFSK